MFCCSCWSGRLNELAVVWSHGVVSYFSEHTTGKSERDNEIFQQFQTFIMGSTFLGQVYNVMLE